MSGWIYSVNLICWFWTIKAVITYTVERFENEDWYNVLCRTCLWEMKRKLTCIQNISEYDECLMKGMLWEISTIRWMHSLGIFIIIIIIYQFTSFVHWFSILYSDKTGWFFTSNNCCSRRCLQITFMVTKFAYFPHPPPPWGS